MADGNTGLMGEAGEEGILPLKRINGKLGVLAQGGGTPNPVVFENHQHFDLRGADQTAIPQLSAAAEQISNLAVKKIKNELRRGGEMHGLTRG